MKLDTDETNITDIEVLPDGRIFVFGTSREVLQVLGHLHNMGDPAVAARLAQIDRSADEMLLKNHQPSDHESDE